MTPHRMVYLSRCYHNTTSAGNKAKTDNELTLQEMGFINIGLPQRISPKAVPSFFYNLAGVLKACAKLKRGDVLLLQYPVKKYFSLLCNAAHLHGAKVIALIHDLGSFRRKKLTVEQEINRLSHADCVIASNSAMQLWLHEKGLTVPMTALGLFDYRSSSLAEGHDFNANEKSIVYAGSLNMRKNAFFLKFPSVIHGFKTYVYGNGDSMPSLKNEPHIIFRGFTPADDFIAHCNCDFGLVWDGDSLDACTGSFGGYLRYNTPHKASFYLRAGLPVIVWRNAAIAEIVEKLGVGITIDSLSELSERLAQVSADDYSALEEKVMALSDKLNQGYFVRNAVDNAIRLMGLSIN